MLSGAEHLTTAPDKNPRGQSREGAIPKATPNDGQRQQPVTEAALSRLWSSQTASEVGITSFLPAQRG